MSSSTIRTFPARPRTRRPTPLEAFEDSSAIAAQGLHTYDLADYVVSAHPLPAGCNITVRGVAPGASLIGLKVFGNSNSAPTSRFIEAIDFAVTDGADVLNESFGGNPYPDNGDDPITLADASAIAAGVTVVASYRRCRGRPARSVRRPVRTSASSVWRDDHVPAYSRRVMAESTVQRNLAGQQHLRAELGRHHPSQSLAGSGGARRL